MRPAELLDAGRTSSGLVYYAKDHESLEVFSLAVIQHPDNNHLTFAQPIRDVSNSKTSKPESKLCHDLFYLSVLSNMLRHSLGIASMKLQGCERELRPIRNMNSNTNFNISQACHDLVFDTLFQIFSMAKT